MKRITVIVIFTLLSLTVLGQKENGKKEHHIEYYHALEVGFGYGLNGSTFTFAGDVTPSIFCRNMWSIELHELQGIRFNPHLILSAEYGINFSYAYANPDIIHFNTPGSVPNTICDMYRIKFMLGLNFKYLILKNKKCTPLVMVNYLPLGIQSTSTVHYPGGTECKNLDFMGGSTGLYAGVDCKTSKLQSLYVAMGYEFSQNPLLNLKIGICFK